MRKSGKMAENKERAKGNKGKNGGGQDGGANTCSSNQGQGYSQSQSQQQTLESQVFPPYNHPPYIPPYPGPQPTYFPGPVGPFYRPLQSGPQRDTDLYELVSEVNGRLKAIETSVTRITPLEKEVTHLRSQVLSLQDSNKQLSDRVTELETFCQTFSDVTDDFITTKRNLQEELTDMKVNLNTHVHSLQNENITLNQKCLDTQVRYMENQLLIFGVEVARPQVLDRNNASSAEHTERENTERVLRDILKDQVQDNPVVNSECQIEVDSIKFDKVTRLGNPQKRSASDRPRPIMARFERYTTREQVRRAGILLNKSQRKYKFYEHFPREIEERRKTLYPIARRFSEQNHKVNLVRDRLYVDNVLYDPAKDILVNETRLHPRAIPNNKQYFSHLNQPQGATAARPPRPPSYYSRATQSQVTHPQPVRFETPNRFSALIETTPKRKARSPIELETAPKRMDVQNSPLSGFISEETEPIPKCDKETQEEPRSSQPSDGH